MSSGVARIGNLPLATSRELARQSFRVWLGGIAAVGFGLRVLYTFTIAPPNQRIGDGFFYYFSSNLIVQGHGYAEPYVAFFKGRYVPTELHPPLWPAVMAILSLFTAPSTGDGAFTGTAVDLHRILGCLLGTAIVVIVGLLGRRIGGWRVGLVAAVLTAVYPHFITLDGSLLSEPLYATLVGALLLVSYDFAKRPTRGRAFALGVLAGFAALTRSEGLFFVPVLLLPLAWFSGRARLELAVFAVVGTLVVVAPWTLRNYLDFHRFVPIAGTGQVVEGANCPKTYYGSEIGSWQISCVHVSHPSSNEAANLAREESIGTGYARQHPARAVLVAGVRVLRIWSLFAPGDQSEGDHTLIWLGLGMYYLMLVAAVAAAVMLRRRGRSILILVAPAVAVSITALVGDGLDRLRYDAEVPMLALAAWTLVWLYRRLSRRFELAPPGAFRLTRGVVGERAE